MWIPFSNSISAKAAKSSTNGLNDGIGELGQQFTQKASHFPHLSFSQKDSKITSTHRLTTTTMSALGRYYSSSTGRIAGTIENDESTLCESFTRKMHIQDSTSGKPTGEVYEDDDKVIIDCRKATPETAGRPQGNDARLFKRDITDAYTQQALRHPQIYHKYETRRSTRVIIDYSAPAAFRHPSAPEGFEDPDDCEWNRSVIPGHPAPQEYIEDPDEREWNKSVIFPPTCRYPSPHEDIKHRDERGWDNLIAQCIGTTAAVKNSLATIAEGENTNLKWEDQCRAQALENAKAKNANQSGGQTPAGVESDWDCDWNKSVPQESLIALAAEKFGGIWARTSQKIGGYWGSAVPSADGQSPLWRTMSVTKTVERQNQQEEGVQQKEGGPGGRTSFEDNSVAKENGMCYESSYESDELDLAESKLKKTHPPSRSLELAKAGK